MWKEEKGRVKEKKRRGGKEEGIYAWGQRKKRQNQGKKDREERNIDRGKKEDRMNTSYEQRREKKEKRKKQRQRGIKGLGKKMGSKERE